MNVLDKVMKPKAIAVIGASTKEKTIGSEIMQRLRDYKFTGNIYPVNPKGGMIEGFQAYTSIEEVPGEVDLAVIVVNQKFVLDTIDQCHRKGVKEPRCNPARNQRRYGIRRRDLLCTRETRC